MSGSLSLLSIVSAVQHADARKPHLVSYQLLQHVWHGRAHLALPRVVPLERKQRVHFSAGTQ